MVASADMVLYAWLLYEFSGCPVQAVHAKHPLDFEPEFPHPFPGITPKEKPDVPPDEEEDEKEDD